MPLDPLDVPPGCLSLDAATVIADAINEASSGGQIIADDILITSTVGDIDLSSAGAVTVSAPGNILFSSGNSRFAVNGSGIAFLTGATSSNSVAISGAAVTVSALESGASLGLQADSSLSLSCNNGALNINSLRVGFFGVTAISQPTITGAKAGNTALASLLTQLAALGLITDSTT